MVGLWVDADNADDFAEFDNVPGLGSAASDQIDMIPS